MKCVVSKAFKKVAEERTKFKQIKRQLKALEFDNEYAGQMTNALNNACWVFDHFEKMQENLTACPGIDIRRLLLLQKDATTSISLQGLYLDCKEPWWTSLDLWVRLMRHFKKLWWSVGHV